MAISPIENNGSIGRLQDIQILKQNEAEKPLLDQNHIHNTFQKEIEEKTSLVQRGDNVENNNEQYDARKEGKGQYAQNGKKKKKEQKDTKDKVLLKGQSHFDIKI